MNRVLIPTIALIALGSGGCLDSDSGGAPTMMDDQPPTVSSIMDSSAMANSGELLFDFSVDDDVTAPGDLTVTASSDNQALVMDDALIIDGDGDQRTLSVTPASGQTGSATLTLTVSDIGGQEAQSSFVLTVMPQQVSFNLFFRDTFSAAGNDEPRTINDKEFDDDATDFNDLAAQ